MKACIRRGANQIGGSAVEIIADNQQRLIIDIGLPLDAEENTQDLLPQIDGLKHRTPDLLGILISHPHQDHYALGLHIDKDIPIFMSHATSKIMEVTTQHNIPDAFVFNNINIFENQKSFKIGNFNITPYLVDHSAYEAYAFLIEADGKRLFYSGDFRAHGRKSKLFESFIQNPPQHIDTLLMEGSCLGRDKSEQYESETELEEKFFDIFKQTRGISLIQTSSQNIDRIVTIYRACKESNRTLVMSGYTGHILQCLENSHLPNFTWPNVKKMSQSVTRKHEISVEMIEKSPDKYTILLGGQIFNMLKNSFLLNNEASFIYSMWDGYKELYKERLELIQNKGVNMFDIHTSGHADIPSLQKFASALNPHQLVPIHTFLPQEFKKLFNNVVIYEDNQIFTI